MVYRRYRAHRKYSRIRKAMRGGYKNRQFIKARRISNPGKVHLFKRTSLSTLSLVDNLSGQFHYIGDGSNQFKINNIPQYTEFTQLFDQYKIVGIKQKMVYSSNSFVGGTVSFSNQMPMLLHVLDFDDGTALTAINDYNQYDTMKLARTDRTFTRFFKPKVAMSTYSGGAFSGYASPTTNPWIDANSAAVEYYGNKFAMIFPSPTNTSNVIGKLIVYTTYYIACRDTH